MDEEQPKVLTFGQWVRETMRANRLSASYCCERALDANGKPMYHSQWNNITSDESRTRSAETLRRIALGLDVPLEIVVQAYNASKGLAQPIAPPKVPNSIRITSTGERFVSDSKGEWSSAGKDDDLRDLILKLEAKIELLERRTARRRKR